MGRPPVMAQMDGFRLVTILTDNERGISLILRSITRYEVLMFSFSPTLCTTYNTTWFSCFTLIKQGCRFKARLMDVWSVQSHWDPYSEPHTWFNALWLLSWNSIILWQGAQHFYFPQGLADYVAEPAWVIYCQITKKEWLERGRIEGGNFIIPEICMLWSDTDTDTREMISESRAGEQDVEVVFQLSSHIFASALIMGFIIWIPWIEIDW